jgi:hypothetical protein
LSRFAEIRRIVMTEPGLVARLTAAASDAELFSMVIALGRERGIELSVPELEEIARANRRAWLERWLV